MSARPLVALGLALAALLLGGESVAPARPALPRWPEEIHPLLGAAPEASFARRPDEDPWADFAGRRFARARGPRERVLLAGGASAAALAPRVEAALAGRADLVLAAREGFTTAQELLLAARFAPALGIGRLVLVDGEELETRVPFEGWTPEWDWQAASLANPWGETLARRSRLARFWLVPARARRVPSAEQLPGYERRLGEVAALARARGQGLVWALGAEGLSSEAREQGRAAGARAIGARGQACASVEELLAALGR